MQRICEYVGIQNASFTPDKELNIRLPTSSYTGVMHFEKWSGLLAHPVYV